MNRTVAGLLVAKCVGIFVEPDSTASPDSDLRCQICRISPIARLGPYARIARFKSEARFRTKRPIGMWSPNQKDRLKFRAGVRFKVVVPDSAPVPDSRVEEPDSSVEPESEWAGAGGDQAASGSAKKGPGFFQNRALGGPGENPQVTGTQSCSRMSRVQLETLRPYFGSEERWRPQDPLVATGPPPWFAWTDVS